MHLKVSTIFIVMAFVGTACAFSMPVQGSSEPEAVIESPELVADESVVVPVSQSATATRILASSTPELKEFEAIVLPISIYILDDADGQISSIRTVEHLEGVYEKVNEIWAQAGIVIEVQGIHRVTVLPAYLQDRQGTCS